jgi:hypothetical protein
MAGKGNPAWIPGKSGNPSGRPKRRLPDGRTLAEAAAEHAEMAVGVLVELAQKGESEAVRKSAADSILDRAFGKATQPISGDDDMPPIESFVDISGLSVESLREIAKIVA